MTVGPTVANAAVPADTRVSVMYGHVRVGLADDWPAARAMLREHIDARHDYFGRTDRGDQYYAEECARAAMSPVSPAGLLFTSAPNSAFITTRYAQAGIHGITEGDLAIVREYPNGHYGWWTIDVKCRVLEIGPVFATVRITGESSQFRRHGTYSLPLSVLRKRPRKNGK